MEAFSEYVYVDGCWVGLLGGLPAGIGRDFLTKLTFFLAASPAEVLVMKKQKKGNTN